MKKNFIYSLCILLCGAIFMSSCEDMLEVDSDRVEYDMSPLTLNDTVNSVLGIMKKIQAVADRQVLLGELRGDLMVVNEAAAVTDIQKIARFEFDGDNQYLSAKDYYAIINNCNIYLARVDTTLTRGENERPMLREYVAVKSARAWTYLQLVTNYGRVPYFTEPILTHSFSQEVFKRPYLGIEEIADKLIEDLRPYADSRQYPMPYYSGSQFTYSTDMHFMPILQLLGDLYLWKGDYLNAINSYYTLIMLNEYVVDGAANKAEWGGDEVEADANPHGTYMPLSSTPNKKNTSALVSFVTSADYGSVSDLANVLFGDKSVIGSHQIAAAPGLYGLSKRQTYYFAKPSGDTKLDAIITSNPSDEKPGDVRIYKYLKDNVLNNESGLKYNGVIEKFGESNIGNYGESSKITYIKLGRPVQAYLRLAEALVGLANTPSTSISVGGVENGAESSYENAAEIALCILKYGLGVRDYKENNKDSKYKGMEMPISKNGKYEIKKRLSDVAETVEYITGYTDKLDENGNVVYLVNIDENGDTIYNEDGSLSYMVKLDVNGDTLYNEDGSLAYVVDTIPVWDDSIAYNPVYASFILDFASNEKFKENKGIHSFGSGDAEWDKGLSLTNDSAIATYLGKAAIDTIFAVDPETNEELLDEEGNKVVERYVYDLTQADKITYLRNIILDECALETALEGYRFTDLIRFARAMDDKSVLAKRVAARMNENKVSMYFDNNNPIYTEDGSVLLYEYDEALYQKLMDETNWYLPLK